MADNDPAAVMAKHAPGRRHWCSGHWYDPKRVACEPYRLAEALVEARKDAGEYDGILWKQGELLTGVANALNSPPPPLTSWSHHDLPEKARAAVDALAASEGKVARVEALAQQYADFADSVPDQFAARVARDVSRAYLAALADQPERAS